MKHKRRLSEIVEKNIRTISDIEQAAHDSRTPVDKVVDRIAGFCGSMTFLWLHCFLVFGWLFVNWFPPFKTTLRFDPPPFGLLTVLVSQEAILLSTFILISQNRQQKLANQRNHLDLQINLLAEQESSHLIVMLTSLLDHHGIKMPDGDALALQGQTDAIHLSASIASGNK
ncbi:MAG: DUF1003 domain-containing protein [Armatimonadota bacterium]